MIQVIVKWIVLTPIYAIVWVAAWPCILTQIVVDNDLLDLDYDQTTMVKIVSVVITVFWIMTSLTSSVVYLAS